MEYTITLSADGTFINLKVKGDITRRTAIEMDREAHALGRELKINKYLVDVTESRNTDSVSSNYEFAYTDLAKAKGMDESAIVALLVSPGDHSHDFVETVCRNAGRNVKIFTIPDEAERYLHEFTR
jgi:hypothetical protein